MHNDGLIQLSPPRLRQGRPKPIAFGPDYEPPTILHEVRPLDLRPAVRRSRDGRLWNEFVDRYGRVQAGGPDMGDRSGPEYRDVIGGFCRRAPVARVPVGSSLRTVQSAVNGSQAAAFNLLRIPEYLCPHLVGGSTLTTSVRSHGGYLSGRRHGTVNVAGNRSPRHPVPTRWGECLHDVEERFLLTSTIRWRSLEGYHSRGRSRRWA